MVRIFGRDYTRSELLAHVGDIEQIASIRKHRYVEGPESGMLGILLRTGSGLTAHILPDRGMDIGMADYRGMALAWRSPTGDTSPALYEERGLGWLRSFGGGLVTTCGLSAVGAPTVDQGEELGLHGRISNTAAREVNTGADWTTAEELRTLLPGFAGNRLPDTGGYLLWASGTLRETRVFGENLRLKRRISALLGENRIFIHDTVENLGWEPAPLMLLYHCNLGYPLLDSHAEMLSPSQHVEPRDSEAAAGLDRYNRFLPPTPDFRERVFMHTMQPDNGGWVTVALQNTITGIALELRYRYDQLPYFNEWQMTGQGHYVLGFEPANCGVLGRAAERAAGRLQMLPAGEQREFHLEFTVRNLEE